RDPYRHLDRRSPLRVLLPLALAAALVALAAARLMPGPPATPTPGTVAAAAYAWPTLPPRPAATPTPAPPPATATPPPATAPATAAATATASATPTAPATATATAPAVAAQEAPAETPGPQAGAPPSPAPPTLARRAPTPTPPPPPTRTPTAAPTATPAAAARLALITTSLDLGLEAGPRPLRFANTGDAPLDWRVAADSTWLTATPPTGTLAPGATAEVAITVDRGALPVGAYTGNLQLVGAGGATPVPVTMLVTPTHTVVSAFAAPTTPINAEGCAEPTTQEVAADVTGSVPPRRVAVYYALNGGTEATKTLTAQGRHYSGTLGPFAEPGALVYSLVVTEGDGQVNRSAAYAVTVQDCPSRVHVLPVTLPVAQRFTLGPTGHNVYTFAVAQPGTIVAQLAWSGTAARLSTLLYGPRHTDQPYEQRTGTTSLAFAFPVGAADVAAGGVWALHLVNYGPGEAAGTVTLTFEPRGAPSPTTVPTAPPASPTPAGAPPTPAAVPAPSPSPSPTPRSTPAPTAAPTLTATPMTPTPRPATPTRAPATATPAKP
ncbi:MAG TPA: hypothetical protein VFW96_06895, partial [Thermomicrobiales bacterium]|nr:hypothetical protein [Thermomicrobiales bacterium]